MVEMPNAETDDVNDKKIIDSKTNHGQKEVFKKPINHSFHPVITQVRSETHLFYTMMYFVKFPERWAPMQ